MGNNASSVLITTDNKKILLGHVKDAKDVKVQGQCDNKDVNVCNYLENHLNSLYTEAGSSTKKIKQVVAGRGTTVYIYDQDNFSGNKYVVYPSTSIIVPPCFTIKSVKQYAMADGKDPKKIVTDLDITMIPIEQFGSLNNCTSKFIVKKNQDINYIIFIIIIVLMIVYRKKIFPNNK
jgi:hypothetical protein